MQYDLSSQEVIRLRSLIKATERLLQATKSTICNLEYLIAQGGEGGRRPRVGSLGASSVSGVVAQKHS